MVAPPRRTLFVDDRGSGMRVTWHAERGFVVLSLWHGDVCTGSFRLQADEAARLAAFIVGHLGELAGHASGQVTEGHGAAPGSESASMVDQPTASRPSPW